MAASKTHYKSSYPAPKKAASKATAPTGKGSRGSTRGGYVPARGKVEPHYKGTDSTKPRSSAKKSGPQPVNGSLYRNVGNQEPYKKGSDKMTPAQKKAGLAKMSPATRAKALGTGVRGSTRRAK